MPVTLVLMASLATLCAASQPNVIVIYTDDQGFGDVSAMNPEAKFETPHFDRLAHEGIAFTNAHSADSVCTPSRYGLLTGRYPWRTIRKRGVMGAEGKCLIPDGRWTLASMLRDNGYATAMVGKWHLGMTFPAVISGGGDSKQPPRRDWSLPIRDMPIDKGFDDFFGIPASLNYGMLAWIRDRHVAVAPTLFTNKKPNPRHSDYRIMPPYDERPVGPGRSVGSKGFPVAPDFIDNQCLTRFTDEAIDWIGKQTAANPNQPFFLYLPLTSPHYPVCPLAEFEGQGQAGAYGEFVIETDHHVGRLMGFLKERGLDQNTLIVMTSDNGPERSWKERLDEYGHDSRGGLRDGKRSVYEGGHRVPFLIRWPEGIHSPGRQFDGLVGQVDLFSTIAEIIGQPVPDHAGEDSQSFAAVLTDPSEQWERLPLINHGNGGGGHRYSITNGPWKLIMPDRKHPFELYDLSKDRGEQRNSAMEHPAIVAKLTSKISDIILRGRTTPGEPQPNDTGYWDDLTWITAADFVAGATPSSLVP